MINASSYRKAFIAAIILHCSLGLLLLTDSSSSRPVLVKDTVNEQGQMLPVEQVAEKKPDIVKAVSVDSKQVMETVNRLKEERAQQARNEKKRQQALEKQAEMARKERIVEQQHLAKLKDESAKLAIARKKAIEEEQKHLKELTLQKEQENKRLDALKAKQQELEKKQQQEAQRLTELKKRQQAEEQSHINKQQAEQELETAKQRQAAQQQAAANAAKQARIAGEVDKYKALIVNAISSRWILPENIDKGLSSQFRIRLAPDGAVLEVSLTRSSGDAILDRSAQTAIYKASPLPVPADVETFNLFRDISLTVRPENVRG